VTPQAYDEKNIRRRVYDALNVLMAMGIISKEKKQVQYVKDQNDIIHITLNKFQQILINFGITDDLYRAADPTDPTNPTKPTIPTNSTNSTNHRSRGLVT
jgi:hypothetical protein